MANPRVAFSSTAVTTMYDMHHGCMYLFFLNWSAHIVCVYVYINKRVLVREGSGYPRNRTLMDVSISILVHLVMKCMIQRINLFLRVQCRHMAVVAISGLRFSQCDDVIYALHVYVHFIRDCLNMETESLR